MKKQLLSIFAILLMYCGLTASAQEITTVFHNDFSEFTNGSEENPGTTDISGYSGALYKSTKFPKWNGKSVYEAGEKLLIGDNGNLETCSYKMSDFGGIIKVSMKLRARDSYGALVGIYLGYSSIASVVLENDQWTDYSIVVAGGSSVSRIKVAASISLSGVLIDDLKVEQSESFYPAPVAKQPSNASKTEFTASWGSVSGATAYLLDVYSKNGSTKEYVLNNEEVTGLSKKVTDLDATKQYFFTVRAKKNEIVSDYSNEIRVVPVISSVAAPVATEATDITDNGFTANWDAVADAQLYSVSLNKAIVLETDQDYNLIDEDFSKVTQGSLSAIDMSLTTSGSLDAYTSAAGWTHYAAVLAAGYMGIYPFGSPGNIQSPALNLADNDGKFKVSVDAAVNVFGTFKTGDTFTIDLIDTDGSTVLESKEYTISVADFATFEADFTKGANGVYVRFTYPGTQKFFIDNVKISQHKLAGTIIESAAQYVETADTHYNFEVSFADASYYTYTVTAYAETVVSGSIDYIASSASNAIKVAAPSAIEAVEADNNGISVASTDGAIIITTDSNANVAVYNTLGQLIKAAAIEAGTTAVAIDAKGVVVVKINDKAFKIKL